MRDRLIDQQRLKAQLELAARITKGGEIDMEKAVQERREMAARIDNKRGMYLTWLKKHGWPQEAIAVELAKFDKMMEHLRMEPFSQQALQLGNLGF